MEKPQPKQVKCRYCQTEFMAEPYEVFGDDDYDTWHEGWEYHRTCPACSDRWRKDKKFKVECLYKNGMLTEEEYQIMLKEI